MMLFSRTQVPWPALHLPTSYSPQFTRSTAASWFILSNTHFNTCCGKDACQGYYLFMTNSLKALSMLNHHSLYANLEWHITLQYMFNVWSLIWLWFETWNQLKAYFPESSVFFSTNVGNCVPTMLPGKAVAEQRESKHWRGGISTPTAHCEVQMESPLPSLCLEVGPNYWGWLLTTAEQISSSVGLCAGKDWWQQWYWCGSFKTKARSFQEPKLNTAIEKEDRGSPGYFQHLKNAQLIPSFIQQIPSWYSTNIKHLPMHQISCRELRIWPKVRQTA